ncbi:MAG: GNAT family N-acetyltransferase [Firmicutes bacterium]|nr:GNAT family N-acetyltransferase [Bacillota bacterium]
MEIRKLTEFDKKDIYKQWLPQVIPLRREIEYLDRAFGELSKRPSIPALSWVHEGFLIAYVVYWIYKKNDGLWIEFIEVAPHLRGRGVGRLVLDDMVEVSVLEGCGGILRCYADFRAMPFFMEYGFVQLEKDSLYFKL